MKKRIVLLLAVFAFLPTLAKADCQRWDVSGKWTLKIEGGEPEVLELKQESDAFPIGSTVYRVSGESHAYNDVIPVMSWLDGNVFAMRIDWRTPNTRLAPGTNPIETFRGNIDKDGHISGTGTSIARKNISWSSDRPMKCLVKFIPTKPRAPSPAPPPVGYKLPDAPYIIASPGEVRLPLGRMVGPTTLTWDAGKDHPYAEVWVRINGGDEKKILEKGKGSMEVQINMGMQYTYILTDDGVTLATVNVVAHN